MSAEETSHLITDSSGVEIASPERRPEGGRLLASAGLIGAGILIEPELLGGVLIGAGIMYGLPLMSRLLSPVMNSAVEIGYSAVASVSDLVAGAIDEVHEAVATIRSDYQRSRSSSIISKQ
jgi:hypothetical protein